MRDRIRSWKSLIHDAVDFTVDLVEEGHASVGRNAVRVVGLLTPNVGPAERINELRGTATSVALGSVRGINRLVQRLTDAGLDSGTALRLLPFLAARPGPPIALRSDVVGDKHWLEDGALGLLNGAVGDYLHREDSELDMGFVLRSGDAYFVDEAPRVEGDKVALFVHGLGTTEWCWWWNALEYHGDASASFGTLLEDDLGYAPIYARYNSGRRVFENGRMLDAALNQLLTANPHIEKVVLIGHSMGGLVVRSACHEAERAGHGWVERVSRVLCLGAPHRGAPLEQLGHLATRLLGSIDLPGTRIPAAILGKRSAGIRDLRDGSIVDPAKDPDAPPLSRHIAYYFISATVTRDRDHPLGKLVGDVLVRVPSASGPRTRESERHEFAIETECFGGIVHHELQNHPDVYAWLRTACESV
jgi:pimeloyl-ACP methyl ester carboxylesterase